MRGAQCISDISPMHNTSTPNSEAELNQTFLSPSFSGSEIQEQLSSGSRPLTRPRSRYLLGLGSLEVSPEEEPLPSSPRGYWEAAALCWLLIRSYPWGWLKHGSSIHTGERKKARKRESERESAKTDARFCNLILEPTHHPFDAVVFVKKVQFVHLCSQQHCLQ